MTDKQKNSVTRTLTSIAYVLVLVGCIAQSNPLPYCLLFVVITGMTTWEFGTVINKNLNLQVNRFITTVASCYLFYAMFAYNINSQGSEVFIPYLITVIYLFVSELYIDREQSLQNWAFTMMSQMYVALPFACINLMAFVATPYSIAYLPELVLAVFVFLWCSDAGAYIVGSLIGKHKLFPRVSPGKTWEGSIGGGIIAVLVSQGVAFFFNDTFAAENSTANSLCWAGLALVVTVFGTWGDLVESLFKRKLGIKDSGKILPGHGGMLDRFDSAILAFPAAVVYIYTITLI
jgi:phosphatidate cytidylyltransferase